MLGMALMLAEQGEPSPEKRLELAVPRARDEAGLERAVDGAVEGRLVLRIGAVEGGAFEGGEAAPLLGGALGESGAGRIGLGRDSELLHQGERLVVDGGMV